MATSRPSRCLLALVICALGCSVPKPNFNDGGGVLDAGRDGGGARRITAVGVGSQHTCVAFDDGSVSCFGNPDHGRLGAAVANVPIDQTHHPLPVLESGVDGLTPLTGAGQLVTTDRTTCGLRADGRAVCWGSAPIFPSGETGQTAASILDERGEASPHRVALGRQVALILTDGVVRSAGERAPLGRPEGTPGVFAPIVGVPPGARVAAIATFGPPNDEASVLALETGEVFCWGGTSASLCGDVADDGESARVLPGLSGITDVCMGNRHACATNGADVFCWGDGTDGRLATATDAPESVPVLVPNSWASPIDRLVCADHGTLLITDGGQELWGWGRNGTGELGVGNLEPVRSPRRLFEAAPGETLDVAGGGHVCLLRRAATADELLCAGSNTSGQLGRPRGDGAREFTVAPEVP